MNNLVLVPVSLDKLSAVLAFMQGLADGTQNQNKAISEPQIDTRFYTLAQMQILRKHLKPGTGGFALIDLCASRPGQEVSFSDVAAHAGMEHKKLRGQLGSLTKIAKKYVNRDGGWPIVGDWIDRDQSYYTMPPENAELWRASAD